MCKNNNLFIVNGRIGSTLLCKCTCYTARGQSLVDYFIMDRETLRMATAFAFDDVTPLSDHSSIQVTLDTHLEHVNNSVQPAGSRIYYRWQDTDKEQYRESMKCVKSQQQVRTIFDNFTPCDTNVNDT